MHASWPVIENILAASGPIDALALRPGSSPSDLDELERHLGATLPRSVRDFLVGHDGQARKSTGLFFGSAFLSVAGIRENWDTWRGIDEQAMNADCADFMASSPPGAIKPLYTHPAWIPLTHDFGGNHVGLDFDPDVAGRPGQVIAFGRDEDTKRLIAPDFDAFLDLYVAELRSGRWTLTADAGWQCPPGTRAWP